MALHIRQRRRRQDDGRAEECGGSDERPGPAAAPAGGNKSTDHGSDAHAGGQLRERRRRSSHFEGSGQNLTRSVALARPPLEGHPWASAARMQVQVQVTIVPLTETPLYKAI